MTLVCTLVALVTHHNRSRTVKASPNFYSLSHGYDVAARVLRGGAECIAFLKSVVIVDFAEGIERNKNFRTHLFCVGRM